MKKRMKTLKIIFLLISALILLTACEYESSEPVSDVKTTYYLGDTIEFSTYSVKVENCQIKYEGTRIDSFTTIGDPEWIAITLTYTNTSDTEININRNVRLINSNGEVIYRSASYHNIWDVEYLKDNNLVAGGTKTGFLQFNNSIADDEQGLTLQISNTSSFNDESTYNFKLYMNY